MSGAAPGMRSIRSRLTWTIMVITALVAGLTVVAGLRTFEGQVRQRAVDLATADLTGLVGEDLGVFPDEFIAMVEELGGGIGIGGSPLADEARRTLVELDRVGLADLAFDEFADDGGVLNILLWDGTVASIDRSIRLVDVSTIGDEAVADRILVSQLDLDELAAVTFEPFGPATEDAAGQRDIESAVVALNGVELGVLVDMTDELSVVDELRVPLWISAGLLTLLAGATTWVLTGRALSPVGAITDRVERITSGTLDGRVPEPPTDDEVGTLARTMNRMLERLQRSDLQRRQFVSDASHELRTPVAVLRSEAEVATRAPESTTVAAFARVVLGETGRLEGLIEDLLTLARGDEHRIGTRTSFGATEVDLDDVVLAEVTRSRRLSIDASAVSAGRVRGPAEDLGRMVGHLLDNAARHARSRVAVGVATDADRVRIWVDDDGHGIAEADRERVFHRFTRLDEARDRDQGGAGLGLAVVAQTVSALGGSVSIDRSPLGGARVLVELPAA